VARDLLYDDPMRLHHLFALTSVSVAIIACGGSTASVGGDGNGDGADGSADADSNGRDGSKDAAMGDGSCLEPVEGSACTPGQSVCASGGDICCIGYAWLCDATTHTWKKEGVGCACIRDAGPADTGRPDAGPFACGNDTCNGEQYCWTVSGGPQLPDGGTPSSSTCQNIPAACLATPTCDCLKAHQTSCGDMCRDDGGHLTVQCFAP
jgi:hypothetical protein